MAIPVDLVGIVPGYHLTTILTRGLGLATNRPETCGLFHATPPGGLEDAA